MVSSDLIQVYQIQENKHGRGISNTVFLTPKYLDEPQFTIEQELALHEIAESFLLTNRMRKRNRRKAKKETEHGSTYRSY